MSQSTPDENSAVSSPSSAPSDPEFEAALRSLARPPQLGGRVVQELAQREAGAHDAALLRAAEAAQGDASPRVGAVLDERYRIVSELGRGGMGVVFGAENLRTGKRVALKWMSLERAEPARQAALIARFDREARAVAKVRHPNVVDVYDVGYCQGQPFLVMELLQGESLRARISRGALHWDEARPLLLGVLRGVAAVHRAGVVHRDLKPDNIFLSQAHDGGEIVPKVLDFGVAAMRDTEGGHDTLTRTGAILGTPAYMALEQLTGGQVDARADVYALGVVLYEMLTQQLPFSARSAADLAVLQATRAPTRPAQHVRALPEHVERLVLGALASDPAKRFASVEVWAQAIEQAAPRRWTRRAALGGAALALVVAAATWLRPTPRSVQPRAAVQLPTSPAAVVMSAPPAEARDAGGVSETLPGPRAATPESPVRLPTAQPRARPRKQAAKAGAPARDAPARPVSLTGIRVDDF